MAMNPEPRQRGGDQVLKGKRTLMSNAHHQRAPGTTIRNMSGGESAPLHGAVRQRVTEPAAAPPSRAFNRPSRLRGPPSERGNSWRGADSLSGATASKTPMLAHADV
jgi:hypothetical protein